MAIEKKPLNEKGVFFEVRRSPTSSGKAVFRGNIVTVPLQIVWEEFIGVLLESNLT